MLQPAVHSQSYRVLLLEAQEALSSAASYLVLVWLLPLEALSEMLSRTGVDARCRIRVT